MLEMLTKCGLKVSRPANSSLDIACNVNQLLDDVIEIYELCLVDKDISPAAYGCAIGVISITLEVPLKTARLLFEHGLALRENHRVKSSTVPDEQRSNIRHLDVNR